MTGIHPLNPLGHAGQSSGRTNASGGTSPEPGAVDPSNPTGGPMIQLSGGVSQDGCLVCVGQKSGMIPKAELERIKSESYSKILAHEQAHSSAAGSFGGGIHIEYDGNGIAVGGHVPIAIPGLDPANPEQSLANYMQIRGAALAPGADASGQDHSVASMASSLMGQAQVAMQNKDRQQSGALQLPGNPFNPAGRQGQGGQGQSGNGQPGGNGFPVSNQGVGGQGNPGQGATGVFQPRPATGGPR